MLRCSRFFLAITFALLILPMVPVPLAHADNSASETETADRPEPIKEPSQQLQNLIFFDHQGTWFSTTSLRFTTNDHSSLNSAANGALKTSIDRRRIKLEDTSSYGISKHLQIGLTLATHLSSHAETTSTSDPPDTTDSGGFLNPDFFIAYRWADYPLSGIYADLILNATPNLFSHVRLADGKDANGQQNGGAVDLSLPAFWAWKSNELGLRPSLQRKLESTSSSGNFDGNTNNASYWSKSIAVEDRYRFLLNRLYLQLGLIFTLPYSFDSATAGIPANNEVKLSIKRVITLGCLLNDRIAAAVSTTSSTSEASVNSSGATGSQISHVESDIALSVSYLY